MWFILAWNWSFLETEMVDWLSQKIVIGQVSGLIISVMKVLNHRASFAACVAAMYLASVVESMTTDCFLELQDMAPPSIVKI